MQWVFVSIDGDLTCNRAPLPTPDEGESITVHRVPVSRLLDEIHAMMDKGYEVDARLWGLAAGGLVCEKTTATSPLASLLGKNGRYYLYVFISHVAVLGALGYIHHLARAKKK